MFALRHYLVIEADSFPRVSLSGNCLHLGTDIVRGQISVHIFAPNRGYFLHIPRLPVKWTAYEALFYGTYTTKSDV